MYNYEVTRYGNRKDTHTFPNYTAAWRHGQYLKSKGIQFIINQRKEKE